MRAAPDNFCFIQHTHRRHHRRNAKNSLQLGNAKHAGRPFVCPLEQTLSASRGISKPEDLGPLRLVAAAILDLNMEVPGKVAH